MPKSQRLPERLTVADVVERMQLPLSTLYQYIKALEREHPTELARRWGWPSHAFGKLAIVLTVVLTTGGCALPILGTLTIGSLSVGDLLTIATLSSTAVTGKGAGEHALDVVTSKDCRLLEAALRKSRKWCEERGASATEKDFHGLAGLWEPEPKTQLAEVAGNDDEPGQWLVAVAAQAATSDAAPVLAVATLAPQPAPPAGVPFRPGP